MDNEPESEPEKNTANKKNDLKLKFKKITHMRYQWQWKNYHWNHVFYAKIYIDQIKEREEVKRNSGTVYEQQIIHAENRPTFTNFTNLIYWN